MKGRSPHVPGGSRVPDSARLDKRGGRTQVTKEGIHGKNIDKHNYLPIKYQSGCPIRSLVLFGSGSPGILIQKGVAFNIITYLPDNLSLDAPAAPWYPSGPGARASKYQRQLNSVSMAYLPTKLSV